MMILPGKVITIVVDAAFFGSEKSEISLPVIVIFVLNVWSFFVLGSFFHYAFPFSRISFLV